MPCRDSFVAVATDFWLVASALIPSCWDGLSPWISELANGCNGYMAGTFISIPSQSPLNSSGTFSGFL
jgi:hypothetical protein